MLYSPSIPVCPVACPTMTPSIRRSTRLACLSLLTSLLAACGGGDRASEPSPPLATALIDNAPRAKFIQSTTVNAEGPATALIVRAHGALAGDVGPLMTVLVDGVAITTIEVRATTPTDYRFTVPALRTGSKVDIAFTNDTTINGADRNLYVSQLTAGDTYMLPSAPGVVLDRGAGAAAFDGIDVLPGMAGIAWNGALRFTWPEPNMTERLTVRASGKLAGNVGRS